MRSNEGGGNNSSPQLVLSVTNKNEIGGVIEGIITKRNEIAELINHDDESFKFEIIGALIEVLETYYSFNIPIGSNQPGAIPSHQQADMLKYTFDGIEHLQSIII